MHLTTERLLLRDFQPDDWVAVQAYQSDPLYRRYHPWTQRIEADVREFVGWFLAQQQEHPRTRFQFAIVLKADGQLIGNCGVRVTRTARREASLGYELDSRHWRQGYATEAAGEMLRFGFVTLGLRRIWAECLPENGASARVLQKLGMREEEYQPARVYFKGRCWDQQRFGILAHEWKSRASSTSERQ